MTRGKVRQRLKFHARSLGVFLKPVPHMFFRVMRHLYNTDPETQALWEVDKDELPLRNPTELAIQRWQSWYTVFKTLPDICYIRPQYTRRLLLTKRDIEGALLLRKTFDADEPYVVGFVLWSKFQPVVEGYTHPLEDDLHTRKFTVVLEDTQLQDHITNNQCADIHLICTRQIPSMKHINQKFTKVRKLVKVIKRNKDADKLKKRYTDVLKLFSSEQEPVRGAGTLLMLYTMYHILYQRVRGTFKYHGIVLDVSTNEDDVDTREEHRESANMLPSTRVYKKVGFKPVSEVPAYPDLDWGVIPVMHRFDRFRMGYYVDPRGSDRVPKAMDSTWKLDKLLHDCSQRPPCI